MMRMSHGAAANFQYMKAWCYVFCASLPWSLTTGGVLKKT